MTTTTTHLEQIHARLTEIDAKYGDPSQIIGDEAWINALTHMTPVGEPVRRDQRWAEIRSERLDERRTLYAIIARAADGNMHVSAHTDIHEMHAAWSGVRQQILGRRPGAQIGWMNALHLIGRTVVNENGADFHVGGLELDTQSGRIYIQLLELDDDGQPVAGTENGILTLDGWTVC